MLPMPTFLKAGSAIVLGAATLLALSGCGNTQPVLPAFPEYPPAAAYLQEQDQRRDQVRAVEAYEARVRLINQLRAAERADAMWRRTEALRAQQEREIAFRESIRRRYEERHFQELREFQSLQ